MLRCARFERDSQAAPPRRPPSRYRHIGVAPHGGWFDFPIYPVLYSGADRAGFRPCVCLCLWSEDSVRPDHPHYETIQQVNRQLRHMWVAWGLVPLGVAFLLMVTMSVLHPAKEAAEPEQLALGFKGVMAAGAALFLIGFWLDGRWTEAQRLARLVYSHAKLRYGPPEDKSIKRPRFRLVFGRAKTPSGPANGPAFKPSKSQLAEQADLIMDSLMLSTKALTVIGLLIGLAAVLGAAAGLRFGYSIQLLLLALAFQLFIYSRHPYYREVMLAALQGELVVEEKEGK